MAICEGASPHPTSELLRRIEIPQRSDLLSIGLALRNGTNPRARHARANQWQQITKQLSSHNLMRAVGSGFSRLGAGATRPFLLKSPDLPETRVIE